MANRKMYQVPENKLKNLTPMVMPSDEEFKTRAKRERRPWGILKRDFAAAMLKRDAEYLRGIGQGRVDRANGLDYAEERNDSAYNLGYYRGYTSYESDRRGWDAQTRQRFDEMYLEA